MAVRRIAQRSFAVLKGLVLVLAIAGSGTARIASGGTSAATGPNIVVLLTDDLSWNLVTQRFMPHVIQLERQGETFDHYIVADSLCCPSRSSIFTGLFPHDSGVFTNKGTDGGYYAFTHHHPNLETKTYAVAIQPHGYLSSMMGKYLNGYEPGSATKAASPAPAIRSRLSTCFSPPGPTQTLRRLTARHRSTRPCRRST